MKHNEQSLFPLSPTFTKQATVFGFPEAVGTVNGSITADTKGVITITKQAGSVADVAIALNTAGVNTGETFSMEVDVLLNGTSCLTTKAKIDYTSGEASQQRSIAISGESETNTDAVIDTTANTFAENTIVSFEADITRTSTPQTEMEGLCVFVKFEPFL